MTEVQSVLQHLFEIGKPIVTSRELAREAHATIADAENALMATASSGSQFELQFIVSCATSSSPNSLSIKRFRSKAEALAFLCEGEGRHLSVHSISNKLSLPSKVTVCQLAGFHRIHATGIALRSNSDPALRASYPLLSRQATIEKAHSSGDLAPQSPHLKQQPTSSFGRTASASLVLPPAAKAPTTLTMPPQPQPLTAKTPQAHPEKSNPSDSTQATSSSAEGESDRSLLHTAATSTPAVTSEAVEAPSPVPAASAPTSHVQPDPSKPAASKGQKTLFDMMKISQPAKRPREGEDPVPSVPAAAAKRQPKKDTQSKASKAASAPKPDTKSLVKLAKASSKVAAQDGSQLNRMNSLLDNDEDSDEEREDEERNRFLQQVADAPSSSQVLPPQIDAANTKQVRQSSKKNSLISVGAQIIECEQDSVYDMEHSSSCHGISNEDDVILGDAASLTLTAVKHNASDTPSAKSPLPAPRTVPRTITAPQKRPREEEAPPAFASTLNSFFNTHLLEFQKQYEKDARSECKVVNGEYCFQETIFYRHKTTKEEISSDQYHEKQREIIEAFEQEKQRRVAEGGQPAPDVEGGSATSVVEAAVVNPTAAKTTPTALNKSVKGALPPGQTTLHSFFSKK